MRPANYLPFATKQVKMAGEAILRYQSKKSLHFKFRNHKDWVTDVDKLIEKKIFYQIRQAFPEHQMLSEESGYFGKSGSDYNWILDPIDGTANYHKGWPYYAISLALHRQDKGILGVVYNPLTKELFAAVHGQGAYLNSKKINVSTQNTLQGALCVMEFGSKRISQHKRGLRVFDKLRSSKLKVRLPGCASLNLCYTAAGRADTCVLMDMYPWDIAAGIFIAEEAGATIKYLSDKESKQSDVLVTGHNLALNVHRVISQAYLKSKE